MLTSIFEWLDSRIGLRKLVAATLLEGVPGGARWRYVWGSTLVFVFSIQLITGVLLMTAYSPSSTQAWNSVHFIQYQMDFGWFIRGLHHFGSQTMVVLIALHMLQVVIAGAQLPPREINWWLGMGLLGVTFGLSLTGYLLPWDQKGYWATRVATNIASNIPVIGDEIKQILVGGADYGNHTLTRFYALHVAVLPGTLIVLVIMHVMIFRRQGVTSSANIEGLVAKPANEHAPGSEEFWPRQAFYDMVACMLIFGIMVGLVVYGHGHPVETEASKLEPADYDYWAKAGQRGLGANLDAAADRDTSNYEARPEWYFLFLFQLLKYFPGDKVIYGTVVIPNGIMLLLCLLPLFGYGRMRLFGHLLGILVMVTLLVLAGFLTVKALMDDSPDGILWGTLKNTDEDAIKKAKHFQESVENQDANAKRACQIAMNGTPIEGGHFLLRNDPMTAGKAKFEKNCGSCHNLTPAWKGGKSASDLGGFASEKWVRGLLENPMDAKYFGLVKKEKKDDKGEIERDDKKQPVMEPALTTMRGWRNGIDGMRKEKAWSKEQIEAQEKEFDLISKWLADQANPREKRDKELDQPAEKAFFSKQNKCGNCHGIERSEAGEDGKFKLVKKGGESAPDFTNYGSEEWIRGMIMRPGHPSRYGERNLMPAFRNLDGPGSEIALQEFRETNPGTPDSKILDLPDVDRELIIRFMRRDDRPIFGGTPIK